MGIKALIAAGSNQGDSEALIGGACEQIGRLPATACLATSTFRKTAPVGPASRAFVNACLLIETSLDPRTLLDQLLLLEVSFGRNRNRNSGTGLVDRPLDLDIVLFGDSVLAGEGLVIPHPRMSFRRFVLEPAAEIAPEMRHPLFSGTVGHFLDCIDDEARRIVVAGASPLSLSKAEKHFRDVCRGISLPEAAARWSVVPVEYSGVGTGQGKQLPQPMNLLIEFSDTPSSPAGLAFPGWTGPRWHVGTWRNQMSPGELASLIRTAAESMDSPGFRHAQG